MNADNFFKRPDAVNPGRFDTNLNELCMIRHKYQNDPLTAIAYGFYLGFLKGQRAAQKETKKQQETAAATINAAYEQGRQEKEASKSA